MFDNEPIETEEYQGFEIKIYQDEMADSPREDRDNLGEMICFHRRYRIGDNHDYDEPREYLASITDLDDDEATPIEEMIEKLDEMEAEGKLAWSPVYMYDHSAVSLSTAPFSCRWDSGQVGFIVADKKSIEAFGLEDKSVDFIKNLLKEEVQTCGQWVNGEMYRYVVELDYGRSASCSGFIGFDHEQSGLLENARHDIDAELEAAPRMF